MVIPFMKGLLKSNPDVHLFCIGAGCLILATLLSSSTAELQWVIVMRLASLGTMAVLVSNMSLARETAWNLFMVVMQMHRLHKRPEAVLDLLDKTGAVHRLANLLAPPKGFIAVEPKGVKAFEDKWYEKGSPDIRVPFS